jgi:tetratricopeptide (TPR) repeat protein
MDGPAPTTDPAALFHLGCTLFENGETDAAIEAYRRSLALAPGNAGTCYNLGNAFLTAGRAVEAVDSFLVCLRTAPGFGAAYVNLSEALRRLGVLEDARWAAEQGVKHLPEVPEARIALANVLHDKAEYAAAAGIYRSILAHAPNRAGVLSNLGSTLHAMGRLPEALAAHDRAVALAPGVPDFHFGRATTRLAAGDYGRGWAEYEWRWQRTQARARGFGEAWRGRYITRRTILLHAEQGLGDTLQFVRYAPLVAERGARVVLEVQAPLVRLVRKLSGVAEVVARGDPLPPFDTHCPLLSLPLAFGTELATIPSTVPYLDADPAAISTWDAQLPRDGLRVGLVWAGSPHHDDAGAQVIDRRRSMSLAELAPLAGVPNVRFVSLQREVPARPDGMFPLIDLMARVTDLADTAALIGSLDLVVSVDTSVAHLAAAIGKPVWLLSRFDGCWRWLHGRRDSPWYPGMRIYRQDRPHDWRSVVAQVVVDLTSVARGRA